LATNSTEANHENRYPSRIPRSRLPRLSCDFKFITRSTINTRETIEFEGKQYPLIKIEVSAESHPFFTGKHKIVDTAGRVEKFRQKFGTVGSKTSVANG
jgi:large subunit ribosomal protein L31